MQRQTKVVHRQVVGLLGAIILLSGCTSSVVGTGVDSSTDGSAEASGECRWAGTSSEVAFPLALSSDRRHLVDQNGVPFLVQGDAAWSLMVQLDLTDVEDYLVARREQGFNALVVNLIEHHFADNAPANVDGEQPFTTAGDFATPNPKYFEHVDAVLTLAAQKGFVVVLTPAYLGYDGGEEGWYQDMLRNGPSVLRDYGRYVGERYASHDNIIWLQGGDFRPPEEDLDLVNAIVEGIKERDPNALNAAHWGPEESGSDVDAEWLDLDTTYTYELVYKKSLRDYNRDNNNPHFLLESAYEQDIKETTPQSLRAQGYYALLTGAVGQVYGHGATWKFDSNWRDALETSGSCGIVHLGNLFSTLPWTELVPDQEHSFLVDGMGEEGGDDYAVAALSRDGQVGAVYLPSVRPVQVDLSSFDGPVRARFFDPSSGTFRDVDDGAALMPAAAQEVQPPGQNADGDQDWVLLFDRPAP
jgi:Protein of unknown function (DUF4038)/Putative collagen-binding domain of a collagenase